MRPVRLLPFRPLRHLLIRLALLFGAAGIAVPAAASPALVFDVDTGTVLYAHDATVRWYPASLTKMMAAYVVFEAIEAGRISLDTPVTIAAETAALQPSMIVPAGTTLTVEEALPLVLAGSIKAVTIALADAAWGSNEAFVGRMNEVAAHLGMTDTRYVNVHGFFDYGHVTTARDQAMLTRALGRDYPQYGRFFALPGAMVGDKVFRNHNPLIGTYPGADGMKSGFICESGFNLVGTATQDGRRLGIVLLGAFSEKERGAVARQMLNAGFAMIRRGEETRLPESALAPTEGDPVDMRPYVCNGTPAPLSLRSFGTMAPLPRPRPG